MQYFFILGKNPTLSFAEIVSVLNLKPEQVIFLFKETLVIDVDEEINAGELIKKLGGTIKIGILDIKILDIRKFDITKLVMPNKEFQGKFKFGISFYGNVKINEKKLAMEFKKVLKEKGVNSRWVTSREKQLSSVVVEQNKLITEKGIEIVIISDEYQHFVGKTLAVQPFKELSFRDYGRPGRNDRSGMLPPKLAQVMINLTPQPPLLIRRGGGAERRGRGVLLDPFCGSGTVLTEAILMGYENLTGFDNSERAIEDTKKNISWIQENCQVSGVRCQVCKCDVYELSKHIKLNSVDAIITEPYLGPSRMHFNESSVKKVAQELEQLYNQAILEFKKVLKSSGRVVVIWPVFRVGTEKIMLSTKKILVGSKFKIVNPLEGFNNKVIKLTNRQTIIYGRENQKVWREVVILERIV